MSSKASLAAHAFRADFRSARIDYLLLAILSALLHLAGWAWWSRLTVDSPLVTPPKVVEILLVAPRPPPVPVVQPPPPPVIPPVTVEPPPPPPKPKPKPAPVVEPKPPTPPPVVTPVQVASPAPIVAPVPVMPAPPAAPELIPASTKATSSRNPKPDYPTIARRRGWEGKVLLAIEVTADGKPGAITVADSSGRDLLDNAAIKAVKRWLFEPARRGDTPVASTLKLSIVFKLEE